MKQDGEDSGAGPGDGGGAVMLRKPTPSRPQLNMPPRIPFDSFGKNLDSNPSPMTLVANFLAEHDPDDSASFSSLLAGAISAEDKQTNGETNGPNGISTKGLSPSSSFAERLAARGSGNKAPGLPGGGPIRPSTARFKSMPPSRLPIPKAPYVTIPPGLSPTTLLDSPVLLSTSHQAEPSPTTGTFPLPPLVGGNGTKPAEKGTEQGSSSGFVFKPFPKTGSRNCLSPLGGMAPFSLSQHISNQAHAQTQSEPALKSETKQPAASKDTSLQVSATSPAEEEQPQKVLQLPASEQKLPVNPPVTERPTDDGFNWRKYGQKLVKGSDNPRSYYKCTYVNCPMKKKVERSPDGQVTEIVYEGEHNHPKPQPTRRMAMSAAHIMSSGSKALAGKNGSTDGHGRADGSEASRNQANGTCEQSSSSTSDEEGNEDGPDAKRRKKEKHSKESPPIPRTVREPRVVVQTTSEVDVLDDGYRWRKYGQKVVKGNPHPRSYYKCTNLGCPVRKHVERACDDPRAVITTYEGKHNHDVPAARNSSHDRASMDAPVAATGSVPTQSGGSDASAMSVHTSVTSPEHGSQLSRLASTLEKQAEDASSRNPEAGLVANRVKTELQETDALPGSPARISAVTSLSSLVVRPKQEPQQDRAKGMKGGY